MTMRRQLCAFTSSRIFATHNGRLRDDGTMTEGDRMLPGRPAPAGFPACRICGCWEYGACWDDEVGACWWVEADLCSHCASGGVREPIEGGIFARLQPTWEKADD